MINHVAYNTTADYTQTHTHTQSLYHPVILGT